MSGPSELHLKVTFLEMLHYKRKTTQQSKRNVSTCRQVIQGLHFIRGPKLPVLVVFSLVKVPSGFLSKLMGFFNNTPDKPTCTICEHSSQIRSKNHSLQRTPLSWRRACPTDQRGCSCACLQSTGAAWQFLVHCSPKHQWTFTQREITASHLRGNSSFILA